MTDTDTFSRPVPRPAHVTDEVFYDFDMFRDPALLVDAHDRILDLVKNAPPIFWTPRNGGHWMLMSHAANYEASRDTESFSSEVVPMAQIKAMMAALPPGAPRPRIPVPIGVDPPEHTKYRAPLLGPFSPKTMMALRDSIRALAVELVEKVKPHGRTEFMSEVAEPLPVQVFLKMFGLPVERQREYRDLCKEHMTAIGEGPEAMAMRTVRLTAIMRDTLLERKAEPRDDLISMLWQTRIDDQETTLVDMESYCVVLFLAGLDTVMNGMGHAARHLARNPELQQTLRDNPKLIPEASEEMLRRYTFTVPPRRVAKDLVFQGVAMKADDRLMLFLPAADLDPGEYPEPDKYNLKRDNNVHIAFGVGPHRCLGAHLARIELQILYEELLARLPPFRLDPDNPVRYHGGHVVGPETLHLVWDV